MYEWETQMFTSYGWECVDTNETKADATFSCQTYRFNDPTSAYRVKKVKATS